MMPFKSRFMKDILRFAFVFIKYVTLLVNVNGTNVHDSRKGKMRYVSGVCCWMLFYREFLFIR